MIDHYELVSFHLCPYVQRVSIVLDEKAIGHRRTNIDLADKPAWFEAISPLGKVPLLRVKRDDDETVLFESAVICEFLEDTQDHPLHPADPLERAHHRAWIEFASATLDDVAGFYNAGDDQAFETKRQRLADRFDRIDRHLTAGPWFGGERFSLVDAAMAPLLRYFDTFERIADFGFFDGKAALRRYRKALAQRPSVRRAVAADYPRRLEDFLHRRGSRLSAMIAD